MLPDAFRYCAAHAVVTQPHNASHASFLRKAKLDLPANADKNVVFCDADGRLSLTAVVANAKGKELAEMLAEGINAEVLSCKMDADAPHAASIISQAQNLPQQQAMRTTELAAVAALKGDIFVQLGTDLSQRVAFQTVRDLVRSQLHVAADDPDLPEVCDFLISNGVGSNTYIDNLLQWARYFVDFEKNTCAFPLSRLSTKCASRLLSQKSPF